MILYAVNSCRGLVSGAPVKRTVAYVLAAYFGLVLLSPSLVRADDNSARNAVQKHNLKQSRREMKRMTKKQKRARKPQVKVADAVPPLPR